MPVNLLAVCRIEGGLVLKRVSTTAVVQGILEGIFVQQANDFLNGVTEEVPFDGGWKPEPNELLTVPATDEVEQIIAAATGGVVGLPVLSGGNLEAEGVRALGVIQNDANGRLVLQTFDARQVLQHSKMALLLHGDTFDHLTTPAFTVGNALTAIVEDGQVKFRSFSKVRQIFSLQHLYIEATDTEVTAFTGHAHLAVENAELFREQADQGIRRLVHAITHRGTLDNYSPDDICAAAAADGLVINRMGTQMVLPMNRQDAKRMLQFLDDAYYQATLTGVRYVTNSKRVVPG